MSETLRRNEHPGKFEGGLAIDEWAHEHTLAGCDEEAGDVAEGGWFGRLNGPFKATGAFAALTPAAVVEHGITKDERRFLARQAGAIVREDGQGFVDVTWFERTADLDRAWARVEAEATADEFAD